MTIGPREHLTWDVEDIPCIRDWDGNYPDEENDNDTPYMLEDDNDEVTTLDNCPF